jgi:glucosyl-dolichyl phosphate glucuronosyltransferase
VDSIIPDVRLSVVTSTYNRGALLEGAVRSILAQQDPRTPPFELIVVDNNSSDNTKQIVERFAAADPRVRYVFEPQQGSSHGRNAGIRAARAPIIAFTDDDVRVEPDWLAAIARAFAEHPEADVAGGRVLPLWPAPPPAWLTRDHWMPLALVDYGEAPVAIDADRPVCLVTANCAFRRRLFETVGAFAPEFQLGDHGRLGSVEDHELQLRVLAAGGKIFYDPRIVVHAEIQQNRLDRAYHRRWHVGHGYFHALLRTKELENTTVGTFFGVPAHLYRQAVIDLIGWLNPRNRERSFLHELRLCFFLGFFRTRRREFFQQPVHARLGELRRWLPPTVGGRRPSTQPAGRRASAGK